MELPVGAISVGTSVNLAIRQEIVIHISRLRVRAIQVAAGMGVAVMRAIVAVLGAVASDPGAEVAPAVAASLVVGRRRFVGAVCGGADF